MGFWSWIADKLAGGVLGTLLDFGKLWLKTRNERIRIKTEMLGEIVRANIMAQMAQRDVLLAEQGWWVTRMIRPAFAYPLVFYYALIIGDSIFDFSWSIARLPDPMMEWSGWIISAYFIARPFEKLGRSIIWSVLKGRGK